jgi:hypothetical protein
MDDNKKQTEWPKDYDHYLFKKLSRPERLIISIVYFRRWRRLVKNKKLKKNEEAYFELYFKEIHTRYYLRVIKGGSYVKTSRLILNFLLSKANENIRAVLTSLTPYNATIFVNAIRSQIEINALLNKYILDADYHKKHIALNEDRSKIKELETVINIHTLVNKLGDKIIPYTSCYDSLSLLLHPNPTGIKFYAQAEGIATDDNTGIFQPKIKFYFNETITPTKDYDDWFKDYIWLFLTIIEHYLILIDSLKNEFFLNDQEKEQSHIFAMSEFVGIHKKEILKAANNAARSNSSVEDAVSQEIQNILNNSKEDAQEDKR